MNILDGMQALDMGFPEFTESMTTDEKLEETKSYLVQMLETLRYLLSNLDGENFNETGLKEITEPITAKIADVAGNVTELEVTAEGLKTQVTDAEGKASAAQQTAEGVQIDVQNLKSRNTVVIDATGLYVIDAAGRQTKLSGDQITSGTIKGITLVSSDSSGGVIVTIENGQIKLRYSSGETTISQTYSGLQITTNNSFFGGALDLTASQIDLWAPTNVFGNFIANSDLIKLNGGGNASFDAGGGSTLYLGVSNYGENVEIGGSGSTVNLNGNVLINGVPLSTGGSSTPST